MAVNDAELMQGLMEDFTQAKAQVSKGGVAPQDAMDYLEPKALRIKGQIVGAKDMAKAQRAVNDVIDQLVFESGQLDNEQQSRMRSELKRRFNQYQMMLLKQASAVEMEIAKRKLDQKQSQAIWGGVSEGVRTGISLGVGGAFNRKALKSSATDHITGAGPLENTGY